MELLLYFAAALAAEGPATYRVLSYLLLREAGRHAFPSPDSDAWTNQWQATLGNIQSQTAQLSLVQVQLGSVLQTQADLRDSLAAGRSDTVEQLVAIRESIVECCSKEERYRRMLEKLGETNLEVTKLFADDTTSLGQLLRELPALVATQTEGATHRALSQRFRELQLAVQELHSEVAKLAQRVHEQQGPATDAEPPPGKPKA